MHSSLTLFILYYLLFAVHHTGHSVGRKCNPPQAARVQRTLDKETTWTTNKPTVDGLLKAWVPPQQKIEDNSPLICSIAEQKWKGLALKDFGEEKGKGKCTYHLDSNHLLKGSEYFYVHIMTDAFLFFFSQVLSHLCPSVKGMLSVIITGQ